MNLGITEYICYFNVATYNSWVSFGGSEGRVKLPGVDLHSEIRTTIVPNVIECRMGFWVNSNFQYTNCEDTTHWISPASIIMISKKTKEDD